MKKAKRKNTDEVRPEYDFASMKGGVQGKYVEKYRAGTNLVLLDPEMAEAFPTDAAENDTLLVPAGRRRDLRHVPLEVVPLARLRATVNVPTCATTLVAGLPA